MSILAALTGFRQTCRIHSEFSSLRPKIPLSYCLSGMTQMASRMLLAALCCAMCAPVFIQYTATAPAGRLSDAKWKSQPPPTSSFGPSMGALGATMGAAVVGVACVAVARASKVPSQIRESLNSYDDDVYCILE